VDNDLTPVGDSYLAVSRGHFPCLSIRGGEGDYLRVMGEPSSRLRGVQAVLVMSL
jgi:hypothetical protein